MATYGDRINEQVESYCDLYDRLLKDDELGQKAKSLALHDLIMNVFVAEQVLAKVEEYIEKQLKV